MLMNNKSLTLIKEGKDNNSIEIMQTEDINISISDYINHSL